MYASKKHGHDDYIWKASTGWNKSRKGKIRALLFEKDEERNEKIESNGILLVYNFDVLDHWILYSLSCMVVLSQVSVLISSLKPLEALVMRFIFFFLKS